MKHLNVELQNLVPNEKYGVTITEGDGSIDLKSWDGVATNTTQDVNLSGTGIQKIHLENLVVDFQWTGDTFDTPDTDMWVYPSTGVTMTGMLRMEVTSTNGATPTLTSKKFIKANTDFDLTLVVNGEYPVSTGSFRYLWFLLRTAANPAYVYAQGYNLGSGVHAGVQLPDGSRPSVASGGITSTLKIRRIGTAMRLQVGAAIWDTVCDPSIRLKIEFQYHDTYGVQDSGTNIQIAEFSGYATLEA